MLRRRPTAGSRNTIRRVPESRWRVHDRIISRKKLGTVPRAFVLGRAGGGPDFQVFREYLISTRMPVVRIDTKTHA